MIGSPFWNRMPVTGSQSHGLLSLSARAGKEKKREARPAGNRMTAKLGFSCARRAVIHLIHLSTGKRKFTGGSRILSAVTLSLLDDSLTG